MWSTDGNGSSAWTLGSDRQVIVGDRARQRLAAQVVMLVGPARRVRNLFRERGGGEDLREQRIRIERDPRHEAIELGRRILARRLRERRNRTVNDAIVNDRSEQISHV